MYTVLSIIILKQQGLTLQTLWSSLASGVDCQGEVLWRRQGRGAGVGGCGWACPPMDPAERAGEYPTDETKETPVPETGRKEDAERFKIKDNSSPTKAKAEASLV